MANLAVEKKEKRAFVLASRGRRKSCLLRLEKESAEGYKKK